jgi:hypothetical protein
MQIFDIEIYRDGGSLEFRIEKDGIVRHVWLETPLRGEPRALLIDARAISKGAPEVQQLLADINDWWDKLPESTKLLVLETKKHKGPYFNPSAEISDALDLRRVLDVRDYVECTYSSYQTH